MSRPALRVERGRPTDAEVAVVIAALTVIGRRPSRADQVAGWHRAALLEGVGGAPATSAADLSHRPGRGGAPEASGRRPA